MASVAFSQEVGGRAGGLWNYGAGARSIGLANTAVAMADDATAGYLNPARLSYLSKPNASLLHAALYEGAIYDYVGLAYPTMDMGAFAATVVRLGVGSIEQRDRFNNITGSYDFSTMGTAFSYGGRFSNGIRFGASLKHLRRSLAGYSSSLTSFDIGGDYNLTSRASMGFVVRDVAYSASGTDDKLLVNPIFGVKYGFLSDTFLLTTQFERIDKVLRFGTEYALGPAALRMGLNEGRFGGGGFGFSVGDFKFDYAVNPHTELGNASHFSITFAFGQDTGKRKHFIAQNLAEKGEKAYKNAQYGRAARIFKEALEFSPNDVTLINKSNRLNRVVYGLGLKGRELKQPSESAGSQEKKSFDFMVKQLAGYIEVDSAKPVKLGDRAASGEWLLVVDHYMAKEKFYLAASVCENALSIYPTSPELLERMVLTYYSLGLMESAKETLRKPVEFIK
ncbi:hypothetical protein ACFL6Y_10035 [Elusimicrobiota bacterium]